MEIARILVGLGILSLILLIVDAVRTRYKKYPSGWTVNEAKKYLEENTHCGKYWGVKAKFDAKKAIVFVHRAGRERVELHLNRKPIEKIRIDFDI